MIYRRAIEDGIFYPDRVPERPIDPPEYPATPCPVCGEDCGTIFTNRFNEVVGCDCCVTDMPYWMWQERNGE